MILSPQSSKTPQYISCTVFLGQSVILSYNNWLIIEVFPTPEDPSMRTLRHLVSMFLFLRDPRLYEVELLACLETAWEEQGELEEVVIDTAE